ncbi:MAG: hypothetical protein NC336_09910 [Clostridium sp.]|nr:hypothetical protein [Clostridium sp.]
MSDNGLPKPYTRIAAVNDSVVIATYFIPRKAGADLFNRNSGELLSELNLGIEQPDDHLSMTYHFKIATSGNRFIVAYRYINRLEFFELDPRVKPELTLVVGDDRTQYDLFEAEKIDQMVKYYDDVQCDSEYAYLLFGGVPEKE